MIAGWRCTEKMAKLKGRWGWFVDEAIHVRLKIERGQAWFNQLKTPFIIGASSGYILNLFGLADSIWITAAIVFGVLFGSWLIGHVDFKVGMWKRENEIRTRDYNPYFEDLEHKVEDKG